MYDQLDFPRLAASDAGDPLPPPSRPEPPEPYHPDPTPGPDRPILPEPGPAPAPPPTEPYRPAPIQRWSLRRPVVGCSARSDSSPAPAFVPS